jgi:malic enzyme
VLGLGDIGPHAALPVMEGKAILFKDLGGVDAFPLCLATKDPDDIIQACKWLEPSFGGINLEDIAKPKCFYILERLREELHIHVWRDDQQGTAAGTLAGLMNALKVLGKTKQAVKISMIGAGAANIAISRVLIAAGFLRNTSRWWTPRASRIRAELTCERLKVPSRGAYATSPMASVEPVESLRRCKGLTSASPCLAPIQG